MTRFFLCSLLCLWCHMFSVAQHAHHSNPVGTAVDDIEPQPLLAHAMRLNDALTLLGSSLATEDQRRIKELQNKSLTAQTSRDIQAILDPYCLAIVDINPEARVKVTRGPATATLMQHGWTSFLVKIKNDAGVTAKLVAESPNAAPVLHISTFQPYTKKENILTQGQVANRFLEIQMFDNRPLAPTLSGLGLEYAVVQIYSKDAGKREAEIGFHIGEGSQDIGFRSSVNVLFNVLPSVKVVFNVKDDDGSPTTASFIITDGIERVVDESAKASIRNDIDYRLTKAQLEYMDELRPADDYKIPPRLTGIYPLPSRRVAAYDEYPDFFFQPQVYRSQGEHVLLSPGKYTITFTRGPEYVTQTKEIVVPEGVKEMTVSFELKRWVNMAKIGWYSADHHVHAAGCSHYESPEEGVDPEDMWRQIIGEDLNVGAVLTWGPGWYHQKQFFTGKDHPLSTSKNVMRHDVEVSGFPSSHAGHVVLLNLKEDDYPGTRKIEDWPSWTLPVFKWAKSQQALTGYAHSGWGLQPIEKTTALPNYALPKMDGIGANEYIVTVTENVVDFFSAGDTPAPWELNMWYHTLNCGFRTRLSGETDYPCIYDERVGLARSYFKPDGALSYDSYINAIKTGRSYVSEGGSHIIDFSVDGLEAGTHNSELNLTDKKELKITAKVVALLSEQQDEDGEIIAKRPLDKQPFWNIERARIEKSRNVRVELIVNGQPVDTTIILADGTWKDISFNYPLTSSSWIALRVYPSAHTNPIFVLMNNKPVRVKKSAEWCRQAVDQCWKNKRSNIRAAERQDAAVAYDRARKIYDSIIEEASAR
ncbi:CehA/McbA family metallohydrolase [Chryseolinea sp. H1M3-3]|uniref:CehA/McbA family metallohydrolase n=1 Tax=Chryseolinea sp. H1M3-3 TaxID=3034144 RepID=UPI0023EC41A4|nr:CehA/McbA family metallohydrolase [Chryseolinea sp. H1M3-3]